MKILLILTLLMACEKHVVEKIPFEKINRKKESTVMVETKIQLLREKVKAVDVEEVLNNLETKEQLNFRNSFTNLKRQVNETLESVQSDYSEKELEELRTKYSRANEAWEYILKNYKI